VAASGAAVGACLVVGGDTGKRTGATGASFQYMAHRGLRSEVARFRRARVGSAASKQQCRDRHSGPELAAVVNPAVVALSMSNGLSRFWTRAAEHFDLAS
jgi:hypothetical protein